MDRNVLLIAPLFMDIYKDVKANIESLGHHVDFIPEKSSPLDPNNRRGYKGVKKKLFSNDKKFKSVNEERWSTLLNSEQYKKVYDVLFVIDGQSVASCLFKELKKRNPELYAVNYLFDTIAGVYRFDVNFKYFDKIYTFDRNESNQYGLNFLPIYWIENSINTPIQYELFAFGRFSTIRYKLYDALNKLSQKENLRSYIKLATDKEKYPNIVRLKWLLRLLIGKTYDHIPPSFYKSSLNTYDSISPEAFRELIAASDTIVDTNATHQDGLTARFMWALGMGKKIITTNKTVANYDFYNSKQIYIVDDVDLINYQTLNEFLKQRFVMSDLQRKKVKPYELTNWTKLLLNE